MGGDSLSQIGGPCVEVIDPGLDGVEPVAELVDGEGGSPEVVGEGRERRGPPGGLAGVPVEQTPRDVVVAIAEDCGGNRDRVAKDSFCGVATAVNLRLNFFDDDALSAFYRFHITQIFRCNFAFPWYSPWHAV